jgi:hypothetical protein
MGGQPKEIIKAKSQSLRLRESVGPGKKIIAYYLFLNMKFVNQVLHFVA